MRALGMFNIVYGSLGLLSTFLLVFVMPFNPLPQAAMVSGAAASAWIVLTGIVMRIWGDRAFRWVKQRIALAFGELFRRTRPLTADGDAPEKR